MPATKFGWVRFPDTVRGDPDYISRACDASVKRLGVERIGLYYQHRVNPKTPTEETVGD